MSIEEGVPYISEHLITCIVDKHQTLLYLIHCLWFHMCSEVWWHVARVGMWPMTRNCTRGCTWECIQIKISAICLVLWTGIVMQLEKWCRMESMVTLWNMILIVLHFFCCTCFHLSLFLYKTSPKREKGEKVGIAMGLRQRHFGDLAPTYCRYMIK